MPIKLRCLCCGTFFLVEPKRAIIGAKFCSRICFNKRTPRRSEIEKTCDYCGKKFLVKRYRKETARFCSSRCLNKGTIEAREPARLKAIVTHGMKGTPEYNCWAAMKSRCKDTEWYLRHGITVFPEWQKDFLAFYTYLGPIPGPAYTVDRYPNNLGNYEPGNVRWASKTEQGWSKLGSKHSEEWKRSMSFKIRGVGNGLAKLTDDAVREIRRFVGKEKSKVIATRFGVHRRTIEAIWKGKTWRHVI